MDILLFGLALVILALGLCNPRLWRDLKQKKTLQKGPRTSMDDLLDNGRADLKLSMKSRLEKKR